MPTIISGREGSVAFAVEMSTTPVDSPGSCATCVAVVEIYGLENVCTSSCLVGHAAIGNTQELLRWVIVNVTDDVVARIS